MGLVVFAILYKSSLAGVAGIGGYSLVGLFAVSLVAHSLISLTLVPIPYYLVVFFLSDSLSSDWGILAPLLAGTVSAAAGTLGQTPTFVVGRQGKRISDKLASKAGARYYSRVWGWVKRHGSLAVFLISAVPNPIHAPLTLALGALKYPPRKWFILTLGGNLCENLFYAFSGYFVLR